MELSHWLGLERGRAAALAAYLGIKPPQVSDWCTGKKAVPLEHCVALERFTVGAVTCEVLRPDKATDFAYLRGLDAQGQPPEKLPAPLPVAVPASLGTGLERRKDNDPHQHPDLERREPLAAALAGPGA